MTDLLTPAIAEGMLYRLMNAEVRQYPYPHFIALDVWPENFGDVIRRNLPDVSAYAGIRESGRVPRLETQAVDPHGDQQAGLQR